MISGGYIAKREVADLVRIENKAEDKSHQSFHFGRGCKAEILTF